MRPLQGTKFGFCSPGRTVLGTQLHDLVTYSLSLISFPTSCTRPMLRWGNLSHVMKNALSVLLFYLDDETVKEALNKSRLLWFVEGKAIALLCNGTPEDQLQES